MTARTISLLLFCCFVLPPVAAQDTTHVGGKVSDYQRSANLRTLTRNKVFRKSVTPNWAEEGGWMWYRVQTGPESHEFVLVDTVKGVRSPAFDHARLAKSLQVVGMKDANADRLPVTRLEIVEKGKVIALQARGKWWQCDLDSYKLTERSKGEQSKEVEQLRPVATGPKVSGRNSSRTTVTFLNHSKGTVELIWLDLQGKRRSYGKVASGAQREMSTYITHVWLVIDEKGTPLGVHKATALPTTVEITGTPATGPDRKPGPVQKSKGRPPYRRNGSSATSPDGKWVAFFKDNDILLRSKASGEEHPLSTDGTAEDGYRGPLSWSPDSQRLVVMRCQPGEEHKVYIVESSPKDQVQPKLHNYHYHKPGDRIDSKKPHLFDIEKKKEIPLSDALFSNPWSIRDIRWADDSSRFTFVYNQRGHQVLRVLAVDAADGKVQTLVDETSKTFIHYSGKYFLRWIDDKDELIWMSERDGWNHLYLYDAKTGKVKNQITRGKWLVRGVDRVDTEKREIWFRAGGIRPGQEPYYVHYARANFDGTGLAVLTEGDGTHTIDYSPGGKLFIDQYSRVDLAPVTELRRTEDGSLVCELERADCSELCKAGWKQPIRFVAKGRDGTTDIYGVIYRPLNFDPKLKYPVIECIYAGPHSSHVPKNFRDYHHPQPMAELGFILVQIDGMGTSNRSKRFHDVCWKNLADSGLPDRILWIKAAAKKYPFMDVSRVGIYGGSAGGQNAAAAVMKHGDFYKVAVADCGCHDNRMDKIWWNEQWMGWPVGPEYIANSNVTLAKGLKGKLLLIVGEMDRNVDPASTMQVVNALIKADKDFDMLVVPGAGHGAAGTSYGRRRQKDYFVRHLLGVEPRSEKGDRQ